MWDDRYKQNPLFATLHIRGGSSDPEDLMNNLGRTGLCKCANKPAHPSSATPRSAAIQNVFILRVIASDRGVKYRRLLPVPWKISGGAIRGIDQRAGLCLRERWEGQWLQYYSCWRRSDVGGFNLEEAK